MKESLAKNAATLLFAVHDDGFNTDENGRIKQTGATHFLSVVGCNEAATEFLTIDPWPGGSAMNYRSGIFDSSENTPTLSKFMGTLKLGMRTGQWAIFGEILATPENHMGAHDYFVLNGG